MRLAANSMSDVAGVYVELVQRAEEAAVRLSLLEHVCDPPDLLRHPKDMLQANCDGVSHTD